MFAQVGNSLSVAASLALCRPKDAEAKLPLKCIFYVTGVNSFSRGLSVSIPVSPPLPASSSSIHIHSDWLGFRDFPRLLNAYVKESSAGDPAQHGYLGFAMTMIMIIIGTEPTAVVKGCNEWMVGWRDATESEAPQRWWKGPARDVRKWSSHARVNEDKSSILFWLCTWKLLNVELGIHQIKTQHTQSVEWMKGELIANAPIFNGEQSSHGVTRPGNNP